mmetsp:Transcript_45012/g.114524  ORF Transcript_45012/g.114524 Transcript_45012/m.114524 type:complete len:202 (+) Transcript_45012:3846-4451(+)
MRRQVYVSNLQDNWVVDVTSIIRCPNVQIIVRNKPRRHSKRVSAIGDILYVRAKSQVITHVDCVVCHIWNRRRRGSPSDSTAHKTSSQVQVHKPNIRDVLLGGYNVTTLRLCALRAVAPRWEVYRLQLVADVAVAGCADSSEAATILWQAIETRAKRRRIQRRQSQIAWANAFGTVWGFVATLLERATIVLATIDRLAQWW